MQAGRVHNLNTVAVERTRSHTNPHRSALLPAIPHHSNNDSHDTHHRSNLSHLPLLRHHPRSSLSFGTLQRCSPAALPTPTSVPNPQKPPTALASYACPTNLVVCREEEGSPYSLLSHHWDVDTVSSSHSSKGHPAAHQGWSSLLGEGNNRAHWKMGGRGLKDYKIRNQISLLPRIQTLGLGIQIPSKTRED